MRGEYDPLASEGRVIEQADEVLVVEEADAVVEPRAVMVHFEDASVALAAVMAPIRLGLQASLAHADATEALPLNDLVLLDVLSLHHEVALFLSQSLLGPIAWDEWASG